MKFIFSMRTIYFIFLFYFIFFVIIFGKNSEQNLLLRVFQIYFTFFSRITFRYFFHLYLSIFFSYSPLLVYFLFLSPLNSFSCQITFFYIYDCNGFLFFFLLLIVLFFSYCLSSHYFWNEFYLFIRQDRGRTITFNCEGYRHANGTDLAGEMSWWGNGRGRDGEWRRESGKGEGEEREEE